MAPAPVVAGALKWGCGIGLLCLQVAALVLADVYGIDLSERTADAINGLGIVGGVLLFGASARRPNAQS